MLRVAMMVLWTLSASMFGFEAAGDHCARAGRTAAAQIPAVAASDAAAHVGGAPAPCHVVAGTPVPGVELAADAGSSAPPVGAADADACCCPVFSGSMTIVHAPALLEAAVAYTTWPQPPPMLEAGRTTSPDLRPPRA